MATAIEKSTVLSDSLLAIERKQCCKLKALHFSHSIEFIYNPLEYAYDLHSKFVQRFCNSPKAIVFLGMNPGPWGMSQTGIPFGEIHVVKEWLKLSGTVGHPEKEHPSRQVLGLDCKRSEVSGKKFWGLFQNLCGKPETFFQHAFVYNYCPMAFMTETGKNITPAELKISERQAINEICDEALCDVLRLLEVEILIAIGRFAETRAAKAVKGTELEGKIKINSIPHPSPRNFSSSKSWAEDTQKRLEDLNLLHILCPDKEKNPELETRSPYFTSRESQQESCNIQEDSQDNVIPSEDEHLTPPLTSRILQQSETTPLQVYKVEEIIDQEEMVQPIVQMLQ